MFADPLVLNILLTRAQSSAPPVLTSLVLVVLLSISMCVRVTCMELTYFASVRVANNARSALVHHVFAQALCSSKPHEVGKLTNLMATDADKIGKSWWITGFLSQWTWAVLSLPLVTVCLYRLVGNAAFIGIASTVITNFLNLKIARITEPVVKRLQERRDERSEALKELLTGMRVIKLEVSENVWHARVEGFRRRELRELACQRYLTAVNDLVGALVSVAIPVSIFAWYTLVDKKTLDSATAFTALAWIAQMQWSLNTLPAIYNLYASLNPSCERLAEFLHTPGREEEEDEEGGEEEEEEKEEDEEGGGGGTESVYNPPALEKFHDNATVVRAVGAVVGYVAGKPVLSDVNLDVKAGEMVVITGGVGSGKSTLLASIAGALPLLNSLSSEKPAALTLSSRRAYVAQKPFLMNSTLRDNILFGLRWDAARYAEALERAALTEDLRSLPSADLTHVGESGVQLSGGQKTRVCLARALYADAEIYLFDDVLSAVDAHTGRFLWDHVFAWLKQQRKSVVLVTHQLQYVARVEVDRVLMLKDSRICMDGPWADIQQHCGESMTRFVEERGMAEKSTLEEERGMAEKSTLEEEERQGEATQLVSLAECERFVSSLLQQSQGRRVDKALIAELRSTMLGKNEADDEADVKDESANDGVIAWVDFKVYLNVFGSSFTLLLLFFFAVSSAAFTVVGNIWLAKWTNDMQTPLNNTTPGMETMHALHTQPVCFVRSDVACGLMSSSILTSTANVSIAAHNTLPSEAKLQKQNQSDYLLVYALLGVAGGVAVSMQTVVLTLCALRASRELHKGMLKRLLDAPMAFFDRYKVDGPFKLH
jgi:ABC-type multidrug transport system fused ATPase/permease subunit